MITGRGMVVAVLLTGLSGLAAPLAAQPGAPAYARTSLSAFVGLGDGPSPSAMLGFKAARAVMPSILAGIELSRWTTGVGVACIASWPESYQCSVGGWTALLVARAEAGRTSSIRLALEAQGGVFRHSDNLYSGEVSEAWGVAASLAPRLSDRWRLVLGGRYLRIYDDAYSSLLGSGLSFTMGTLGLEYRR